MVLITNKQANKHFFIFQRRWTTAWTSWMARSGLNLQAVNRGMLEGRRRETTKRGRRKKGREWESNCHRDLIWSAALPPSKVSVCTRRCIFLNHTFSDFIFIHHVTCRLLTCCVLCVFCASGTAAMRNTKKGSWFIQELNTAIRQRANDTHLSDILVQVKLFSPLFFPQKHAYGLCHVPLTLLWCIWHLQ